MAHAQRYHVDGTVLASGNGQQWATAFKTLEEGLDAADVYAQANLLGFAEVWVREWVYLPTGQAPTPPVGALEREASFWMRERVRVYGAFVGNETLLSQRQGSAANTILSGDLLGDSQTGVPQSLDDDSYHVVAVPRFDVRNVNAATSLWTLDSFTVEFGNADAGPTATSQVFHFISPITWDGGGIFFQPSPMPMGTLDWVVSNVTVRNCRAVGRGAGVSVNGGGSGNAPAPQAWCGTNVPPIAPTGPVACFSQCTFRDNLAEWVDLALPNLSTSKASAGAMFVESSGPGLFIQNCVFEDNAARRYGGGFAAINENGEVTLVNCLFTQNSARAGAGIYLFANTGYKVALSHSTVAYNNATAESGSPIFGGGGIYAEGGATNQLLIQNSIVNRNVAFMRQAGTLPQDVAGPGFFLPPFTVCAQYSNIGIAAFTLPPGGGTPPWFNAGMQSGDPAFINGPAGNLRLSADSPCIDAGNDLMFSPESSDLNGNQVLEAILPLDLDLLSREYNSNMAGLNGGVEGGAVIPGVVDLGCYEVR